MSFSVNIISNPIYLSKKKKGSPILFSLGIDTSHQANQSVLALTKVKIASANEGLGDVDSLSPLLTINSLGLVVSAELNSNIEVMRFDNTLNVSNWVKYRLPGFSKMMGLSLG